MWLFLNFFVDEVEVDWHRLVEDVVVLGARHASDVYIGSTMVDVHYIVYDVRCLFFGFGTCFVRVNFLCLRELRFLMLCFIGVIVGIIRVHIDCLSTVMSPGLADLCVR